MTQQERSIKQLEKLLNDARAGLIDRIKIDVVFKKGFADYDGEFYRASLSEE